MSVRRHAVLYTSATGGTALSCSEFYLKICLVFGEGKEVEGHPGVIPHGFVKRRVYEQVILKSKFSMRLSLCF